MKTMRFFSLFLIATLVVLTLPAQRQVQARPALPQEVVDRPEYAPGEMVVGFEMGLQPAEYQEKAVALAGDLQATIKKQSGRLALFAVDPEADLAALIDQVSAMDGVVFAEPNYATGIDLPDQPSPNPPPSPPVDDEDVEKVKAKKQKKKVPTFPNDMFNSWANAFVREHLVWPDKVKAATVCLVDTGVDMNHPDLKGNVINGYDFVNDDPLADDDYGHGTAMAGVMVARVNNNLGPAGISNGKVLAVKALGPEGWGWNYDIYLAIEYCAGRADVKVINLSLGGQVKSWTIYNAIYDAAMSDKLIVAAAGNSTSSNYFYPAAWASSTVTDPGGGSNVVYPYVASVSAVVLPYYDIWVDSNGNRVKENAEIYGYTDGCATTFSNYGSWITLVAPGDELYTTTPVSYPSYYAYNYGITSGYAYLSGSSPAAAIVSAAAARAYGTSPTSGSGLKTRLVNSGLAVVTANENAGIGLNPSQGYNQSLHWTIRGQDVYYGEPFDYDLDGWWDTILAPFCWPSGAAPFTSAQNTSNARRLNVAAAMGRMGLIIKLEDALTGLPLAGADIYAKQCVYHPPSQPVCTKKIGSAYVETFTSPTAYLLNLPSADPDGYNYYYQVFAQKKGYTRGYQQIMGKWIISASEGWAWYDNSLLSAAIPPIGKLSVVANYDTPLSGYREIDLSVFVVGYPQPGESGYNPAYRYIEGVGPSNPLASSMPSYYDKDNTFWDFPYARYNLAYYANIQSVTINTSRLRDFSSTGRYYIYISSDAFRKLDWAWPVVRVWYNGGMLNLYRYPYDAPGCTASNNYTWWRVDVVDGINGFGGASTCGVGAPPSSGGIWPQ